MNNQKKGNNEGEKQSLTKQKKEQDFQEFIDSLEDFDEFRLPQRAYHIIRLAIRNLVLPPGKTVLEREMSEILQMSRTPVREALVRLEMEGVVRLVPRRGFIVEPIVKEDLKEIYEIVETLDGFAIELATSKVVAEQLERLELIIAKQEQELAQGNLEEWSMLDDLFHSLIIQYAENKRLSTVIDSYADQSYRARLYTINQRPVPALSIAEHKAMIACMRADDGKAARIVMHSHRRRAQKEILHALDQINHNQLVDAKNEIRRF